jgi:hypothetical protein
MFERLTSNLSTGVSTILVWMEKKMHMLSALWSRGRCSHHDLGLRYLLHYPFLFKYFCCRNHPVIQEPFGRRPYKNSIVSSTPNNPTRIRRATMTKSTHRWLLAHIDSVAGCGQDLFYQFASLPPHKAITAVNNGFSSPMLLTNVRKSITYYEPYPIVILPLVAQRYHSKFTPFICFRVELRMWRTHCWLHDFYRPGQRSIGSR